MDSDDINISNIDGGGCGGGYDDDDKMRQARGPASLCWRETGGASPWPRRSSSSLPVRKEGPFFSRFTPTDLIKIWPATGHASGLGVADPARANTAGPCKDVDTTSNRKLLRE